MCHLLQPEIIQFSMISVALKQFREPLEEAYRQRRTNDLKQDPINVDPL